MAGIGEEARIQSTISSDIDCFRNNYSINEQQTDGSLVHINLVAPAITLFDKYRFYILQNCSKERLELKYRLRPDYLSYDKYGTTNWWNLILYINDIPTIEEFDIENVLIPNLDCIGKLNEIASDMRELSLINYDQLNKTEKALLYTPKGISLITNKTIEETVKKLTSDEDDSLSSRMRREEFVMDIATLRTRCVDLEYPAVENSVVMIVKGKPNYSYGKHYILTESSDNKKNRVTWDPKIVTGSGLVFRLKEKDVIQVTYVSK